MYLEIPKFKRCCCCLPLRIGIIILGYLSLGYAVFTISVEVYFIEDLDLSKHTFMFYRGAPFYAQHWLFFAMYCIEIAFIVVLLVGAHTRSSRLLLVYYYFSITTTLASLVIFLYVNVRDLHSNGAMYLLDLAIVFCAIVTQGYLLLLIRSQLEKPLESLCFVNHLSEVCVRQRATNGLNPPYKHYKHAFWSSYDLFKFVSFLRAQP